ncbi:hypothetical protein ACIOWI_31645 [Streptomyces sp. NPDC087659]|uniref:hypothetical protein n=1 Tax=Streptomyces sp. NPDC087659 TaxID=3365801 RepID=UPI00380B4B1B
MKFPLRAGQLDTVGDAWRVSRFRRLKSDLQSGPVVKSGEKAAGMWTAAFSSGPPASGSKTEVVLFAVSLPAEPVNVIKAGDVFYRCAGFI